MSTWILCEDTLTGQRMAMPAATTGVSFDMRKIKEEARTMRKTPPVHPGHIIHAILRGEDPSEVEGEVDERLLRAWESAEALLWPGGGGHFPARGIRTTDSWDEVVDYTSTPSEKKS